MELYLIRHGEAAGDPHRFYPAPTPEAPLRGCLTELGDAQARDLAIKLRSTHFDALYSSPLGRALQTAQPICFGIGVPISVREWLREWRPATELGRCEEGQWEEIERAANALRPERAWHSGAGESTFEFAGRVIPPFIDLLSAHGAHAGHGGYLLDDADDVQRLAIVAHGGTLGRLAGYLLGIPLAPYVPLGFAHAGMAVFEFVRRVDVWYPQLKLPAP